MNLSKARLSLIQLKCLLNLAVHAWLYLLQVLLPCGTADITQFKDFH